MLVRIALQGDQPRTLLHVGGDANRKRAKQFGITEDFSGQFVGSDQPMAPVVGGIDDMPRVFYQ